MDTKEHLLTCLAEECAEVQQAASKALRFGLADVNPTTKRTNEADIMAEFNDILAIVELLEDLDLVKPRGQRVDDITRHIDAKKKRVVKWMDHARETGALVDEGRAVGPKENSEHVSRDAC